MLEDLFYGNLTPCDMDRRRDTRIQPLLQKVADTEDALRVGLPDEGKEKLDAFANANTVLNLLMMDLAFQDGFRIAAGLALDLYTAQQRKKSQEGKKECH